MTRKAPLIERAYKHTTGGGIAINLTRYVGASFRIMRGSDDRRYLVVIGWYPRTRRLLRHWQASVKLPA